MRVIVEDDEDWLNTEYREQCAREADDHVQLAAVRQALAKMSGSLTADFLAERSEP